MARCVIVCLVTFDNKLVGRPAGLHSPIRDLAARRTRSAGARLTSPTSAAEVVFDFRD